MGISDNEFRHLIIGGTIKGATSSVFTWLSAHPEVCGSSVKETYFFSSEYSGDAERDRERYGRYFTPAPGQRLLLEASPNYLGYKENVAPRIRALLPDAKLLFILRNPVDRLYSYFNFAAGKLELPQGLTFEAFVDRCEQCAAGTLTAERSGLLERHLRALEIGNYHALLRNYLEVFPATQIKVVFFEHLRRDPQRFMAELCGFAGISVDFYRDYAFNRVNVTFSARLKPLHHLAMALNRGLESLLRQRPGLKTRLVGMYKRFNQGREGYTQMADATRARLAAYYAPANRQLKALLPDQETPPWVGERPPPGS